MTDLAERLRQLQSDFAAARIPIDSPGFYEDRGFVRREQKDPTYLDNYVRFVQWQSYSPAYLETAEQAVYVVAAEMQLALQLDGTRDGYDETPFVLSRMLEREGIWNYVVCGTLTLTFPSGAGFAPYSFRSVGVDGGSNVECGYKWVYAPPFRVIDITIQAQDYPCPVTHLLPKTVLEKDTEASVGDPAEMLSPAAVDELRSRGYRWKRGWIALRRRSAAVLPPIFLPRRFARRRPVQIRADGRDCFRRLARRSSRDLPRRGARRASFTPRRSGPGWRKSDLLGTFRRPRFRDKRDDVNDASPPNPAKRTAELIETIKELADKLASDHTSRGDLKSQPHAPGIPLCLQGVLALPAHAQGDRLRLAARLPTSRPTSNAGFWPGDGRASMAGGHRSGQWHHGGWPRGAGREHSMGLNILLPFEQSVNPIIAGDRKLVYMKYFFTRKLMFVKESDAFCLMPGGFGTLDEGLEVLTLLQTGKHDMMPVVLLDQPGGDYWTVFNQFVRRQLLDRGMIGPEDLSLYRLTDQLDEAVQEVLGFYRVYHSMRYVRTHLVFRLQQLPSPELMEEINDRFRDILVEGRFTVGEPLPEEHDETELAAMPRLVFRFNRRSYGRLRQLIDCLNARAE